MKTRILTGLVALVAFAAMAFPTLASAEVPAEQVPADLRQAIRVHVESQQKPYARLCREANPVPGQWCGFVLSLSATEAEVTYGPAASGDITRVIFNKEAGVWRTPSADNAPPELKTAIAAYVSGTGKNYVGLCLEANPLPGQYCGFILSRTETTAMVTFGPYASDEITRAQFRVENGGWRVSDVTAPGSGGAGVPRPPQTGDSQAASESPLAMFATVLGLSVLAATGGMLALRARSR